VRLTTVSHIGKESNRLEDVQVGLVESLDDVVNHYDDVYARVYKPLRCRFFKDSGCGKRLVGRASRPQQ